MSALTPSLPGLAAYIDIMNEKAAGTKHSVRTEIRVLRKLSENMSDYQTSCPSLTYDGTDDSISLETLEGTTTLGRIGTDDDSRWLALHLVLHTLSEWRQAITAEQE